MRYIIIDGVLIMEVFFIGEYIKNQRETLRLTQEQVCDGICDPATLSRIENGHHTPSRTKVNALLQRLGLPGSQYYAFVSKNELEIEALKKEIVGCNITDRVQEGFDKIAKLEAIISTDDLLTKQFILRSKAALGGIDGRYSIQQQLNLLMEALHLTIPHFALEQIQKFLYTFDEAKIINQIALCYSGMEQHIQAITIYQQLLQYIHTHYQEVSIAGNGILPMVLHNYARELDLVKQYEESIKVAKEGQQVCVRYGHYQFLPGFIAFMAECYFFCGELQKSTDCYFQAYYMYRALDNQIALSDIRAEAKKHLDLEFPY